MLLLVVLSECDIAEELLMITFPNGNAQYTII